MNEPMNVELDCSIPVGEAGHEKIRPMTLTEQKEQESVAPPPGNDLAEENRELRERMDRLEELLVERGLAEPDGA